MSKKYILLLFLIAIFSNSYCDEIKNQEMPWYINSINADKCIDIYTGKNSMVMIIDIFDTPYAIPNNLELLKEKIYYLDITDPKGEGFTDNPPENDRQHTSPHATAIAGLIAGSPAELKRSCWLATMLFGNISIVGVASGSKIIYVGSKLELRELWSLFLNAFYANFYLKNITVLDKNGIQKHLFNTVQKTSIINFSAGIKKKEKKDEELNQILEHFKNKNILLVIAAGNDGVNFDNNRDFYYLPQEVDKKSNIILVAATNKNNMLCDFSNRSNKTVDIAAPGEDISLVSPDNTGYVSSGTSYAAPLIAGTLALGIECNPTIDASELKEKLLEYAKSYEHLKKGIKDGKFLDTYSFVEAVCFSDDGFSKGKKENPKETSKIRTENDSWSDHIETSQTINKEEL